VEPDHAHALPRRDSGVPILRIQPEEGRGPGLGKGIGLRFRAPVICNNASGRVSGAADSGSRPGSRVDRDGSLG